MGRRLKGKVHGKGLKAALLVHQEEAKLKKSQAKLQNVIKQKEESIKKGLGGGKKKKAGGEKVTENGKTAEETTGLVERDVAEKRKLQIFIPFGPDEKVLLVGDGDLSYAVSILQAGYTTPENLVVTSYDSGLKELELKYPHTAAQNYKTLTETFHMRPDVNLLFKIDCTKLVKTINIKRTKKTFAKGLDAIVFNFPHTGRGMKDMERNVHEHQVLMLGYFASGLDLFKTVEKHKSAAQNSTMLGYSIAAASCPPSGGTGANMQLSNKQIADAAAAAAATNGKRIVVSLFEGEPYNSWAIKELARMNGLKVSRSGAFEWDAFPGYSHRKTNSEQTTTKPQKERKARIYAFVPKTKADDQTKKRKPADQNGRNGRKQRRKGHNHPDTDNDSDQD